MNKAFIIGLIVLSLLLAGLWWYRQAPKNQSTPIKINIQEKVKIKPPVIDYDQMLSNDPELAKTHQIKIDPQNQSTDEQVKMIQARKTEYQLNQSVDLIVKPGEAFKVNGITVPMQTIIDKIRLKQGGYVEEDLRPSRQDSEKITDVYGIYIVRPLDNLWNIHFTFLKEYFESKKIKVEKTADEPTIDGRSSGIGKLLKFSEKMVFIYNLKTGLLETNLDVIHPLTKIIIFRLGDAFALLEQINARNISQIQFDGETLWILQ